MERILYFNWDNDSTTLKYGKYAVLWSPGKALISTSGSSTTVTADTAGSFADVKVGDLLRVLTDPYGSTGPSFSTVRITAKADDDEITVSSALDLTAAGPWQYLVAEVPATGTAAGWFNVAADAGKTVHVTLTTVAATGGIELVIEGKGPSGFISPIHSVTYTAATDEIPIPVGEDVEFLRVGLRGVDDFAGTDVISVVYTSTERN